MNILKVIHGYPPTYNAGSEVYSQNICEELAKNHTVAVFTREQDEYRLDFATRTVIQNGIPITLINLPREKDGYEHPKVNVAFQDLLIDFKPDVVHIGHLNHLSLGIVKVAKSKGISIVFTLHDFWLMCPRGQFLQRNFDGEQLYQLCEKQVDRKCATNCYRMLHSCQVKDIEKDTIYWIDWIRRRMESVQSIIPFIDVFIAPSQYLKNRFVKDFRIPSEKIIYLDYGFSPKYLRPIQNQIKRPFTFGYIGTHIPAKGVNLLITAFKNLLLPCKLIIWGRPLGQNTESLKRLAAASSNPVVFEGEYDNKDIVKEVFEKTDSIVVPSIWGENSPLVIHEAQACHIPVITADYGGMKEYVQHQVNGLLFEHRNPKDLATKLQWAVNHPKEMRQFGERGYLYTESGKVPEIEQHCEQLTHIYQQQITKNGN